MKAPNCLRAVAVAGVFYCSTAFVQTADAQQVIVQHSDAPTITLQENDLSLALTYGTSTMDALAPGEGPKADEKKDEKPPRLFHYSIRLGGRFVYSDNINAAPEPDAIEDFYISLEPSVSVGLGDVPERKRSYIRLEYSPNALLYFDTSEFNTINHFIRLEAVANLGKLTLSLYQDVHLLEGVDATFDRRRDDSGNPNRDPNIWRGNRDIGGRNNVQFYNTTVVAKYDFSDKAWVTGAFRYNHTNYENLFTLDIYSGDLFFDYKLRPELTVGIGGAGGVVYHDDPNIDEEYQEARARFTFDLPKKININGSVGLEFRQFGREGSLGYTAPIIEANVSVEPVDGTRLTVGVRHRTLVSNAMEGQSFTLTGANVGLRQRITKRVDFNINSGYEQASYFNVLPDVIAERRDEYFFVEPSIDWRITDKWTVGAYYIHRENVSNTAPFGFAENQAGVRMSVTF